MVRVPALRAALALLFAASQRRVRAGKDTHTYTAGEDVVVWTDKVGPYNNPQETYEYSTLGLCELEGEDIAVEQGELSIGETLEGHAFYSSPRLDIHFGQNKAHTQLCSMVLTEEKAKALAGMINDNYWYQIYIDDLPIWAFVGEHSKFALDVSRFSMMYRDNNRSLQLPSSGSGAAPPVPKHLKGKPLPRIYTHRHFTLFYNNDQIIEVDMEPSSPWPIYGGAPLNLSYTVQWFPTSNEFKDRTNRYLDPKFFEHKVHWFSIVNSFMLCLFLCAVVAIILMKTLKRDFTRYSASEAEELENLDGVGDESGWKQVNGDVFRKPDHLAIFTVVYASGCHLACTVFIVLIFAICNSYYASRGATAGSFVIAYLCTVIVGGYEGGRIFRMFGGQHWKRTMVYQCLFMPGIAFISFVVINTTAIFYRATMIVPFKTIFIILVLFLAVCVPLHTVGTLLGRRAAAERSFPCRVHHLKRPIPTKHWAFTPIMTMVAGIVPFGCLFIEMYFILSAVWSHNKIYYVYGFMFAILILLCLVIVCVSITCTYILLNAEDYRWQWQSYISCAATALYVFAYTIHYFYNSTQMSGFLQTVYYFGTSLNFCIGLSLFCGSLGFIGASKFVFLIYSNIKAE
ncbi:TM9SF3 [Symbiodinium natans]|uniref:Transmembrane 9 superfamily member n=1 Tax=Symbiodinium natans TaxID=878477 RepID=A0A812VCU6_9DINO|nr:TM9SF3 [Symbiodinium natans]